jgi:NAD(P)-dependent dehydrogenase (short-subunit alcohol dehydrogenase family)
MRTVLVTGASRGIGRATTERLASAGWDVYAGVRRAEDGTALTDAIGERVHPVQLELTSPADIAALDERLPAELDALVNNAGYVLGGPVEAVRLDDLRQQLEVNVVGQIAVTQAVLPRLRASRGRIVFVSSLSGRIATPLTGPYNASKFAIEALADAARMELHPWGIGVSVVEPAQTDTDIWRTADAMAEAAAGKLAPGHAELYRQHLAGYRGKVIPASQRVAKPVDTVVAAIERALTARRPKARYVVGGAPRAQLWLATVTPAPVLDALLRRLSGVPRKA